MHTSTALRLRPALAFVLVLGLTACGYRFIGFCSQIGTPEVGDVRYEEVIEVYLKPEAGAGEP